MTNYTSNDFFNKKSNIYITYGQHHSGLVEKHRRQAMMTSPFNRPAIFCSFLSESSSINKPIEDLNKDNTEQIKKSVRVRRVPHKT